MDVVIEGKALVDDEIVRCCVGIQDGRIARIAKNIDRADRRFDFSDLLVLPAGVDLHVHFRDPGLTNKEDFETGSMAAAAGGTACVVDMPNTRPPVRTAADLEEKASTVGKKSYVDFGLAALLDDRTDIDRAKMRAAAFKIYLGETTGGLGIRPDSLRGLMAKMARIHKPLMIHAEHLRPLEDMDEKGLHDHDRRRAGNLELEAVQKVCGSEGDAGCVHLVHVTQPEALRIARARGFTTELTPHHLLLDSEMPLGSFGKINPPLRTRSARIGLWEAFVSGEADTIGSDHSPHSLKEKEVDFNEAPSGMPGAETLIPLMLQKVAEARLDIGLLARCCSTKPAEIMSLKKGRIVVGNDADLIVVDLRKSVKLRADKMHSKCGWNAFEGMQAIFPAMVMLRGEEVAQFGEITGERRGRDIMVGGGEG